MTGATGYKVYRASDDTLLTTINTATSNWAQSPLSSNTQYSVYVRATNANREGIASNSASAYTSANAPTNASHSTVTTSSINWTWSSGTNQKDYYAWTTTPVDNSGWITDTFWNQTGLSSNTSDTVFIKARNQNNDETGSISVSAYTLAPTPTNLSATAGLTTMDLSVDAFNNPTAGSSGYYFSNSTNGTNSGWIQTNSWSNSVLTCGTSYTYSVEYRNGDGIETDTISLTKSTNSCPGGGLPPEAYNLPKAPNGGFKFLINQGANTTRTETVTLSFIAGQDTTRIAISNYPDFNDSGQEAYQSTKQWDLCSKANNSIKIDNCPPGQKTVYAKFYTQYGQSSPDIWASIIYDPTGQTPAITAPVTNATLIRYANSPKVYLIENNQKRWIQTAEIFNSLGYDWKKITVISSTQTYPDGPDLTAPITPAFTKNLKLGSIDGQVKLLQQYLNAHGFKLADKGPGSPGKETTLFGSLTKKAVKLFQRFYKIPQTGIVDKSSREILNR